MKNNKKPKILLLNLWRVNNATGGTEKVFFEMANNLDRLGYQVFCVSYDTGEGRPLFSISNTVSYNNLAENIENSRDSVRKFSFILDRAIKLGRISYHNFANNFPFFDKPIRIIKQCLIRSGKGHLINQYISKISPNLIISFQPEATDIVFGRKGLKTKVITMFHMNPLAQFEQDKELFIKSLKKSAAIQTLRPEFREQLIKKIGTKNVVYIPNIVPQHSLKADLNSKVITFLGRFDKLQKRPHLLVEAFSRIASSFPDWIVKLYGEVDLDSEYTKYIREVIKKGALEERILLMGVTDKPLMSLRESSIFVLPSSSEGFGLALTEAMSLGIACVGIKGCAAVDGLIVDHQNGLLAEPTPTSIATAIGGLMQDSVLRKRLGSRAKVSMEEFNPDKVWSLWDELITKTLEGDETIDMSEKLGKKFVD